MRMKDALLALTEAVRIARLEIECYHDEQCRSTSEWTVERLATLLCNKEIDAAMALVTGEQDSPSIVPVHSQERHDA